MDILDRVITYIVNPAIYFIVGLAVMYFLWGVFNFIRNAENSEKRVEGARHILWGVVGIAIMFSVFALVRFISNTVGSTGGSGDVYPESLR